MSRIEHWILAAILCAGPLVAQPAAVPTVKAQGTGTVSVQPDQAHLTAAVVTQGATAEEAARLNASLTASLIAALRAKLGPNGTVQTSSYTVMPRYSTSNADAQKIVGYTASNSVSVTTNDLGLVGPLIDAANQAGANSVGGLSFGLKNPEPVMQSALALAAKQAMEHAAAIARGLGGRTGAIVSAEESSGVMPMARAFAGEAGGGTPIEAKTVTVSASVTVTAQLVQ